MELPNQVGGGSIEGDGGFELALLGRIWQFERGNGSIISRNIRLRRNGEIAPRQHSNESAWRINEGALEFTNAHGRVTCRFDSVNVDERGAMTLRGAFLPIAGVVHILREVRALLKLGSQNKNPRVALLVRTHLVNDKLFDLLDLLNQSRRYDLFVSADETRNALDVRGYDKLPHSTASCLDHGLSTNHSAILWHCGDYPLYFAAAQIPGYDYYIMIEYDLDFVRKSPLFIEGLISRLQIDDNRSLDLLVEGGVPAHSEWCWSKAARRMFSCVYTTGIFSFVLLSDRAVKHLLEKRREEARAATTEDDIIHCEAFCASAIIEAGYECASINSLVDGAVEGKSFHPGDPERPERNLLLNQYHLDNARVEMVHPVYDLSGYLERGYLKSRTDNTLAEFLTGLSKLDQTRKRDAEVIAMFRELALFHSRSS